jgi:CRP/FNR family transcriptional regulator
MKSYRRYPAGSPIAFTGDEMSFVATIVSGCATLSSTLKDGREQMVGLLLPGAFLGSPGVPVSRFDVVAETEVTLCCFERRRFEALLDESSHVCTRLREVATDDLDAARAWMVVLGRKNAREKLASFLLLLFGQMHAGGYGSGASIDLPLRREAIANYIGSTIETVSRQLTRMRKEGLIDLHGLRRIELRDRAGLFDAAAEDDAPATRPA